VDLWEVRSEREVVLPDASMVSDHIVIVHADQRSVRIDVRLLRRDARSGHRKGQRERRCHVSLNLVGSHSGDALFVENGSHSFVYCYVAGHQRIGTSAW
jgi:hypothetical protein